METIAPSGIRPNGLIRRVRRTRKPITALDGPNENYPKQRGDAPYRSDGKPVLSGTGPRTLSDVAREHSKEALTKLLGVMRNPKSRPCDVIKAAEIIIERGEGKPHQAITVNRGPDDNIADDIRRASEMLTIMLARPRDPIIITQTPPTP